MSSRGIIFSNRKEICRMNRFKSRSVPPSLAEAYREAISKLGSADAEPQIGFVANADIGSSDELIRVYNTRKGGYYR